MFVIRTGLRDFSRLSFSASGRAIVADAGRTRDGREGYEVWSLPPDSGPAHADSGTVLRGVEWDADADELHVPRDSRVEVVGPAGKPFQTLTDTGWVRRVAFAPGGGRAVAVGPYQLAGLRRHRGRWARDWSVAERPGKTRATFESVAAFPDGRRFVALVTRWPKGPSGAFRHALVERDFATGAALAERTLAGGEAPEGVRTRLAVTPDGGAVVGFVRRSVRIWPADPALKSRRVTVSKKDVWDIALSPDGRRLLVANDSAEVALWDALSWKPVASYDWGVGRVRCVAFSPDGLLAVAGGDGGAVAVWDAEG